MIADGIVLIIEDSSEKEIRGKIRDTLIKMFSLISGNDFVFVKVNQKKISIPEISKGIEFGFPVIKKLAGQGTLYIRLKSHCTFVLHNDDNSNQDNNKSIMVKTLDPTASNIHSICPSTESASLCSEDEASLEVNNIPSLGLVVSGNYTAATNETLTEVSEYRLPISKIGIKKYIEEIHKKRLIDPVEILRYLQESLLHGRPLHLANDTSTIEGLTNCMTVDRDNILDTRYQEFPYIEDYCITFEIDFMGEIAKDLDGPRLEWIELCNREQYIKHF